MVFALRTRQFPSSNVIAMAAAGEENFEGVLGAPGSEAKYIKLKLLGTGSFGKAWLVQRSNDKSQLVAKVMNLSAMSSKDQKYMEAEIQCLAACHHFAIIRYVEDFVLGTHMLILMEFADAGDLNMQIKARAADNNRFFEEHEIAYTFVQLCMAVDHVHRSRMLHRDIKGANVLLMSSGLVKLGDFGFSQQYEDTVSGAVAGTFCGTPYYLAPELWKRQRYSKKADVWSLGILLYEIAALQRPFVSSTMVGLMDRVISGEYEPLPATYSEGMHDLVKRMLCFDPNSRPDTRQILAHPYMQYVIQQFEATIRDSTQFGQAEKDTIATQIAVAKAQAAEVSADPTAGVEGSRPVQFSGVVSKLGSRGWKQRYLVLSGDEITVSLVPASAGDTKTLPVKHITHVLKVAPRDVDGREYVFALVVTSGMQLMFQAPNDAECSEWMARVQDALRQQAPVE